MLKGIPKCLSPELLKIIAEMGHGDTIVIGDAFYPSASNAASAGIRLVRADGVRATEIIDGILTLMPLDVDYPADDGYHPGRQIQRCLGADGCGKV